MHNLSTKEWYARSGAKDGNNSLAAHEDVPASHKIALKPAPQDLIFIFVSESMIEEQDQPTR
jgi:hypothetical protein